MNTMLMSLAVLLALASAAFWMLRPGARPPVGSAAPDFTLQDQFGRRHRLGDYADRWLVLYFYPRDDTPGCTQEACRFRDDIGIFGELGAVVIGISIDSTDSHAAFTHKYDLPFTLLSDPHGCTAAAYGSLVNLGLVKFARRQTFIVGPDGRIAARHDRVDPARHAAEVAARLLSLRG
ncbi:MAG: peroxiredoxin [Pseudomonadota bacterium]